ncbi:MAG: DMT family transporter [Sulfitobacter sp.]
MDNIRGAVLMVLAMLGFAIEDMFIKLIGNRLPVGQILLVLGTGGAVIFGAAAVARGDRLWSPQFLSLPVILRGLGEVIGTMAFVSAIVLTPISSASAILQATPLVVTLGAALFLGETVGWRRWSAIGVGFVGVLMIIQPGTDSFSPLSLLALLGVFGLALRDLATRKTPASVTSMQLSFLGFAVMIPASPLMMFATSSAYIMPAAQDWGLLALALSIGVFAYYGIVAAMRVGEVSFVTPFRYTRLVYALVIGVTVFGETPDAMMLLGAAVIVASGVYTVLRERKQRRRTLSNPVAAR